MTSKAETVAWLRSDGEDGSMSTMVACITDRVKKVWLGANPVQVERYTLPLVLRSDYEAAIARAEKAEKISAAMIELQDEELQYQIEAETKVEELTSRAERAEATLRELVAIEDGPIAFHTLPIERQLEIGERKRTAWAAARAIVEGK